MHFSANFPFVVGVRFVFFTKLFYFQDSVLEVRKNFLNKLYKNLFRFQIHVSFLSLFAMVAQVGVAEQFIYIFFCFFAVSC